MGRDRVPTCMSGILRLEVRCSSSGSKIPKARDDMGETEFEYVVDDADDNGDGGKKQQ